MFTHFKKGFKQRVLIGAFLSTAGFHTHTPHSQTKKNYYERFCEDKIIKLYSIISPPCSWTIYVTLDLPS